MISPDLCVWLCVFLRVGGGGVGVSVQEEDGVGLCARAREV